VARSFLITTDVHACFDEFVCLLEAAGFRLGGDRIAAPADGRRLLFGGDLVDRGPDPSFSLLLLDELVRAGQAELGALGNHDCTLLAALRDEPLPARTSGLNATLAELLRFPDPAAPRDAALRLFERAPLRSVYRSERLLVTHAAVFPVDRDGDGRARYLTDGVETAERDALGRALKDFGWAEGWRGSGWQVCCGHNTTCTRLPGTLAGGAVACLDSGCVFGGSLSGLLWPERSFLTVPSLGAYASEPGEIRAAL